MCFEFKLEFRPIVNVKNACLYEVYAAELAVFNVLPEQFKPQIMIEVTIEHWDVCRKP